MTQRFGQNGETGHEEVKDLMSFDHSIQVPVNVRGSPRELVTSEDKQTCEHMMQPPDSKRNAKITWPASSSSNKTELRKFDNDVILSLTAICKRNRQEDWRHSNRKAQGRSSQIWQEYEFQPRGVAKKEWTTVRDYRLWLNIDKYKRKTVYYEKTRYCKRKKGTMGRETTPGSSYMDDWKTLSVCLVWRSNQQSSSLTLKNERRLK